MFRPILIPTIAHGITDIVDYPKQTILTYTLVCPLVYHFPLPVKTSLLLAGSVYHMRHEMPGLRVNIMMHLLWIHSPIIAELYLSFIHTPRHYYRTLLQNSYGFKSKIIWIGIMTILTILEMIFKYTDQIIPFLSNLNCQTHRQSLVPLWWVGPVLAHIYMTDFYIPNKRHIL